MVGKGLTVKNFSNLTMQEVAPEVTCISTNRQVPFSSEQLALAELPSLEKYFRTSEVEQEQVARLLTEVAVVRSTNGYLHSKCTKQDQPCLKVARWPPQHVLFGPLPYSE